MQIAERLTELYQLGPIVSIRDVTSSQPCYLVDTAAAQQYIYKLTGRADFLAIDQRVQLCLIEQGLPQSRLIPDRQGRLMADDGYSLLTYLPGETPNQLSEHQLVQAAGYLRRYNHALRAVPFQPTDIETVNLWDEVKPLPFLLAEAPRIGLRCPLPEGASDLLNRVTAVLRAEAPLLDAAPKQLIHSDVGPGNLVYQGDEVVGLIDFTPEYAPELYSLAHLLYWVCLFPSGAPRVDLFRLASSRYLSSKQPEDNATKLLLACLAQACLFRLLGPLLHELAAGEVNQRRLSRRLAALQSYLDLRGQLGG